MTSGYLQPKSTSQSPRYVMMEIRRAYIITGIPNKISIEVGLKLQTSVVPMEAEMKKVLIAIFLTIAFAQLAFSQIQTAKVTGGEVQGVVTESISIFKGIPFAAPPVGDLRWKAPAPVAAWTGIKKADAFGLAQTRGFETFRYDQLLLGQLRQIGRSERTRPSQVASFCREQSKSDGARCGSQRETCA